jgi:hypothetical protein
MADQEATRHTLPSGAWVEVIPPTELSSSARWRINLAGIRAQDDELPSGYVIEVIVRHYLAEALVAWSINEALPTTADRLADLPVRVMDDLLFAFAGVWRELQQQERPAEDPDEALDPKALTADGAD